LWSLDDPAEYDFMASGGRCSLTTSCEGRQPWNVAMLPRPPEEMLMDIGEPAHPAGFPDPPTPCERELEAKNAEIARLLAELTAKNAEIARLQKQVAELKAKLGRDWPPPAGPLRPIDPLNP
jgi:hypothetical protein